MQSKDKLLKIKLQYETSNDKYVSEVILNTEILSTFVTLSSKIMSKSLDNGFSEPRMGNVWKEKKAPNLISVASFSCI